MLTLPNKIANQNISKLLTASLAITYPLELPLEFPIPAGPSRSQQVPAPTIALVATIAVTKWPNNSRRSCSTPQNFPSWVTRPEKKQPGYPGSRKETWSIIIFVPHFLPHFLIETYWNWNYSNWSSIWLWLTVRHGKSQPINGGVSSWENHLFRLGPSFSMASPVSHNQRVTYLT